jgi:FkbM family methyltransferase
VHKIVLDIGANTGFYGLFAASQGCQVYSFDPQPQCGRIIKQEILVNGFEEHMIYINKFVSNDPEVNECVGGVTLTVGLEKIVCPMVDM